MKEQNINRINSIIYLLMFLNILTISLWWIKSEIGFDTIDFAIFTLIFLLTFSFIYSNIYDAKQILLEYIIPIGFVLFTVHAGLIGFHAPCHSVESSFMDHLFCSFRILTLAEVIYNSKSPCSCGLEPNIFLYGARITAILSILWTFHIALIKAIGLENKNRIWLWGYVKLIGKGFDLVIGDNNSSISLALKLKRGGRKVFFLGEELTDHNTSILSKNDIWYITGNTTLSKDIKKTHFQQASDIYLSKNQDEENIRTFLEIKEMLGKDLKSNAGGNIITYEPSNSPQLYINVKNHNYYDFVSKLPSPLLKKPILYNIHLQVIRTMIREMPFHEIDNSTNKINFILFGFNEKNEILLKYLLQIIHFTSRVSWKITIIHDLLDKDTAERFKAKHPFLINKNSEIWNYAFSLEKNNIEFHAADFDYLDYNKYISIIEENNTHDVLFFGFENGIKSASIADNFLSRLSKVSNYESSKVFAYVRYPYADVGEKNELNEYFKNNYPNFSFKLYGDTHETIKQTNPKSSNIVKDDSYNKIAKFLNLYYNLKFNKKAFSSKEMEHYKDEHLIDIFYNRNNVPKTTLNSVNRKTEMLWDELTEDKKLSNYYAADHAIIKNYFNKHKSFLLNKSDSLFELEHRRWVAEKLLHGYQYELAKNMAMKTHNSLRDYEALPVSEKQKDKYLVDFILRLLND